jgi:hypothetical protein
MISQSGDPAGHRRSTKQEMTMFKTISAAVLAVSILSAPAMAATVIKTGNGHVTRVVTLKPSVANAHARTIIVKKKVRPYHAHRHYHRHHAKKVVVIKHRY